MLIMYPDVEVRRQMLFKLHDIENNIWMSCGGERITAFADEDLDRSTDDKTSVIHFLRFQLLKITYQIFSQVIAYQLV